MWTLQMQRVNRGLFVYSDDYGIYASMIFFGLYVKGMEETSLPVGKLLINTFMPTLFHKHLNYENFLENITEIFDPSILNNSNCHMDLQYIQKLFNPLSWLYQTYISHWEARSIVNNIVRYHIVKEISISYNVKFLKVQIPFGLTLLITTH